MKILLLGKDGQVGWQLQRSLAPHGDVVACGRNESDLSDVDRIRSVVREVAPSIIVNATAYTAVDKAESEPELAAGINAVAPGVLAEEAKRVGALLVQLVMVFLNQISQRCWETFTQHRNTWRKKMKDIISFTWV